jgi:hypothetical protein
VGQLIVDCCSGHCWNRTVPSSDWDDVHSASAVCVDWRPGCRLDVSSHWKLRVAVVVFRRFSCPGVRIFIPYAHFTLQAIMVTVVSAETADWLCVCIVIPQYHRLSTCKRATQPLSCIYRGRRTTGWATDPTKPLESPATSSLPTSKG